MSSSTSGSKSSSKSSGKSTFSSSQDVWAGQQQPLKDLYAAASQQFQDFDPSMLQQSGDYSQKFNAGLSEAAMPAWQNQLAGGYNSGAAAAAEPALMKSLQNSLSGPSNTGKMYEGIVGGAGNTYIDPMVDAMKRGTVDSLNRQLPGISENAIAAGQMGSSRHGIAEGLARSDANKYMGDQESMMRGQAYDKDLNWKMDIAKMADSNIGAAQDRSIGLLNSRDQAAQGALQQGQQMSDYGQGQMNAQVQQQQLPWEMLSNYSNIIGAPTVLTQASGSSKNSGSASAKGASHGSSMK